MARSGCSVPPVYVGSRHEEILNLIFLALLAHRR